MLFCKEVRSWLDILDDAGVLLRRLEILENLIGKCSCDIPLSGCRFMDDTVDGYDGSEMLLFLDESLEVLIKEYKDQIRKYEQAYKTILARIRISPLKAKEPWRINGPKPIKPLDLFGITSLGRRRFSRHGNS